MRRPAVTKLAALVEAWLVLDFFGEARRSGGAASTLTTTIFSQSFLALVVAALLYPEPPLVPFAAANLCLSTLLVAIGALDDADAAARRAADRVLVGTAPVSRLLVAAARAGHASFRTMLLTIGMALPPAILLACRERAPLLLPGYLLAACASTALAVGSLAVLLRACRAVLGGARTALVAGTVKALLLGFGTALFLLAVQRLQQDAAALPIGRAGAELLPPYHLAKLLAAPLAESWRLLPLGGLAALLLLGSALLGEREREHGDRVPARGLLQRPLLAMLRPGPERGVGAFTGTMLWRSASLRSRVLPLFGLPAAMAFLALRGGDERQRMLFLAMALQFPAIYLPFVIAFLPRAEHAGTRWVFDSAPALPVASVQRAAWAAMCTHLLLPVHALAFVVLLLTGVAPLRALAAVAFALGTGAVAARAMVRALDELPFTRDATADEPLELGGLMASALVLAGAGAAFATSPPAVGAALAAGAVAAALVLARPPRRGPANGAPALPRLDAGRPTPGADGPEPDGEPAHAGDPAPARHPGPETGAAGERPPRQELRRELWAIAALYLVLSILPFVIGLAFAPRAA